MNAFFQIPEYLRDRKKFTALFRLKLEEMFGVDLRSLAISRIGIGCVILVDLFIRSRDLRAFYTDAGVLTRLSLLSKASTHWSICIHLWNGTPLFQAFLFLLAAAAAVGLVMGYRTRWMTFMCWFLTASLHERNFLVCQGGDDYLRMLLFWSLFLPMGARFSIDSARNPSSVHIPTRLLSWATLALVVQTGAVYISTATFKSRGYQWWNGDALFYALSLDDFAKRPAFLLLLFPRLLKYMTFGVLAYEFLGSFLLISPIWNGPVRTLGVLGFICFHFGILASMWIGPFQWVSIVAAVAFLPPWFWEHAAPFFNTFGDFYWVHSLKMYLVQTLTPWLHRLPQRSIRVQPSKAAGPLVLFFLYCIIRWDLAALYPTKYPCPPRVQAVCFTTHITQGWAMFSPNISSASGWYIIPGKLKDGRVVDLLRNGKPVSWAPPAVISAYYKNERWHKYLANMALNKENTYRTDFSQYFCRSWNQTHSRDEKLESLEFVSVEKIVLSNYRATAYDRNVIWQAYCSTALRDVGPPLPRLSPLNVLPGPGKKAYHKHTIVTSPYSS